MAGEGLKRNEGIPLQEARLWRERYRVLFDRDVAGIILTTPKGRIPVPLSSVTESAPPTTD